jgi:phosphoribosylaminoimidazole-succinocarboxamide synthase
MDKKQKLYEGKAKSVYATESDDHVIVDFRDDTTAFDGAKKESLQNKGETNCAISNYIMTQLSQAGVPTHFVEQLDDTTVLCRHLNMLPVECVVRNIATGSLCRRLGVQSGLNLTPPLYELFLKNDELHDPLINDNHAISFGWATEPQLQQMKQYTLKINQILRDLFSDAGLILVDAKFEFGVAGDEVVLGDEISPDSCRIWDALTKEPLDKDRFRQDLGGVMDSYQEVAKRLGVSLPHKTS